MKLLILKGLTEDGLSDIITEAFQSLVYLLLTDITVQNVEANGVTVAPKELRSFVDDEGDYYLHYDLLWLRWLSGEIPSTIGIHTLELTIPPNWMHLSGETKQRIESVTVCICILGLVVNIDGQAKQHFLMNPTDQTIEKSSVQLSFNTDKPQYPVTTFTTEEQLLSYFTRPETINVVRERQKLPRLKQGVYWPPSERTGKIMLALSLQGIALTDLSPEELLAMEGPEIQRAWEPIWSEHPIIKKNLKKPNNGD